MMTKISLNPWARTHGFISVDNGDRLLVNDPHIKLMLSFSTLNRMCSIFNKD